MFSFNLFADNTALQLQKILKNVETAKSYLHILDQAIDTDEAKAIIAFKDTFNKKKEEYLLEIKEAKENFESTKDTIKMIFILKNLTAEEDAILHKWKNIIDDLQLLFMQSVADDSFFRLLQNENITSSLQKTRLKSSIDYLNRLKIHTQEIKTTMLYFENGLSILTPILLQKKEAHIVKEEIVSLESINAECQKLISLYNLSQKGASSYASEERKSAIEDTPSKDEFIAIQKEVAELLPILSVNQDKIAPLLSSAKTFLRKTHFQENASPRNASLLLPEEKTQDPAERLTKAQKELNLLNDCINMAEEYLSLKNMNHSLEVNKDNMRPQEFLALADLGLDSAKWLYRNAKNNYESFINPKMPESTLEYGVF